jgi:titin
MLSAFFTNLFVLAGKSGVVYESARPEGLEKIKQLEGHGAYQRPEIQDPATTQRPMFTAPLQNIDPIAEGQTAHFECRLIPVNDPTLKVEWFRNEQPIETGITQEIYYKNGRRKFYPN